MTEERVQVRLVPKDADGQVESWNFSVPPGHGENRFFPDPNRALAALGKLFNLGLPAVTTRLHTVKAAADTRLVETTFKTKLVQDEKGYYTPERELTVPEELRDTVAFAYIPTPVEYCGATAEPPEASAHHLRLDQVARVLGADICHERGHRGSGIQVAVIDTGLAHHPYFKRHRYKIRRFRKSPGGDAAEDKDGHGTAVAANVLAVAPDCTVLGVKGFAAEGLSFSLAQGANVINCSWGWDIDDTDLMTFHEERPNLYWELVEVESILRKAHEAGAVVLFSGGNGGYMAPGCFPEVISVGGAAVDREGKVRASNYASGFESSFYPGRKVPDVCGVMGESGEDGAGHGHILLPVPKDSTHDGMNLPEKSGWGLFSGTSAATPQVAGVVALMMKAKPTLTPEQIKQALIGSCQDVVEGRSAMGDDAKEGPDLATGAGLVDAWLARQAALYFDLPVKPPYYRPKPGELF